MAVVTSRAWVRAPIDEVFAFFDDPSNLGRLMPPPVSIRVDSIDPQPVDAGSVVTFRYGLGPVSLPWVIRFVERVPPIRFVDETLAGPMRRFHHSHSFHPARRGGTWIEDRIDYHVGPDGLLGVMVDGLAGVVMRLTFVWRHAMQRRLLG